MAIKKAYEMPFKGITLVPEVDLSEKQYTFVNTNATGDCINTAAGATAVGVLQTPGIVKEPCNVMVSGISFIKLGATVAAGASMESDKDGLGITLATGKSNGICMVGGVLNDIGSILIK